MTSEVSHATLSASASAHLNKRMQDHDGHDGTDPKKLKLELDEKLSRGLKAMSLTYVIQTAEIELNLLEHKAIIAAKEDEIHVKAETHRALINALKEKLRRPRQARSAVTDRSLYEEYKLVALKFVIYRAHFIISNLLDEAITAGFSEDGESKESLTIKRDKYAAILLYYRAKLHRKSVITAKK